MPSRIKSNSLSSIIVKHGGSFVMPGDFKVTVEILGKEQAEEEMPESLAQYLHDDHRISLRKSRSLKNRKADLEHELGHMCIDWADHFIRKSVVPL